MKQGEAGAARVFAAGYMTAKRIATPTQSVIVPAAERALFARLTRAIAASHQRAAARLISEVAA